MPATTRRSAPSGCATASERSSSPRPTTHKKLGLWERDGGRTRWLIDDPKRNLEYAYAPRGVDSIVAVETDAARSKASLIDPDLGVGTDIGSSPGVFLPLAWTGDEWVGTTYSAQQPRDLVRVARNVESFTLTRLWDITPLRPTDFVAAEDVRWKAPDGLEIQGWLYRTRLPSRGLVVHVHGGPTAHSEDRVSAMIQFLVAQGFDVLEPNYRGSTGFGLRLPRSRSRKPTGAAPSRTTSAPASST